MSNDVFLHVLPSLVDTFNTILLPIANTVHYYVTVLMTASQTA